MSHELGCHRKPDGLIVVGEDAPVYRAFVLSGKRYSADFMRGFLRGIDAA